MHQRRRRAPSLLHTYIYYPFSMRKDLPSADQHDLENSTDIVAKKLRLPVRIDTEGDLLVLKMVTY